MDRITRALNILGPATFILGLTIWIANGAPLT